MKKLFLIISAMLTIPASVYANPACAVCTIAIGASLSVARRLGVEDAVVGLWAGALLTLLGYWTIVFFDKRNWHFYGRNFLIIALSVGMIGFIYINETVYTPVVIGKIFYLDPILFSALLGMAIYIYSQKFYLWLKKRNGGHAHFPFEKVVLPLAFLSIASLFLNTYPI